MGLQPGSIQVGRLSWSLIVDLCTEKYYQAKKKRIYQSYVEQFFIDFLAGFCLRRAISHLVLQVGMESAQCEQCGQVFAYLCVNVCMYSSCNFFDTSFGNETSQLRINEITLHSVYIEVRGAFSSGTFIFKIPFLGARHIQLLAKFYQMIFTPCLILSLLVVCRARLDEYRAVRNAVEEVLDVSLSPPCPSNGTEFQELILSSSKREYHTDLSQKNIIKNRQSNDRATRLPSVWS